MIQVLHIGDPRAVARYSANCPLYREAAVTEAPVGHSVEEYLAAGREASFLIVDAMQEVPAALIDGMPNLRMIHSEGVAFNRIDCEAARAHGVYVCNSRGMNAGAVAEQTILLMLGCLRNVAENDKAVREGRQMAVKMGYIERGDLLELSALSVGLVGFGDIAKKTAALLRAFGVREIYCTRRHPLTKEEEETYGVQLVGLPELLAKSRIVSLHVPVTPETTHLADTDFFAKMQDGAYFINTSRGELVDDAALAGALRSGKLTMAGLDTLDGEPIGPDHYLLKQKDLQEKLLYSPHIGGVTGASFQRSYAMIWDDISSVLAGRRPERVVNNL
ncbi:MAG: NAD(P)-dependent oxidoreductase [Lachnospiraceae bacterium]